MAINENSILKIEMNKTGLLAVQSITKRTSVDDT